MTSIEAPPLLSTADALRIAFPAQSVSDATVDERRVCVIAQGVEPRWIILGDTRKASSVLSSWKPWNLSSRVKWSAVQIAAYLKLLPNVPGVQSASYPIDYSYWLQNLAGFSRDWNTVIHVGNSSHTRKAILFFIAEDGRVKFAAKVPIVHGAADAILNESAMLRRLRAYEYLPKVLFEDAARGIAVQTWLEGKPVSRGFTPAHLNLLNSLVNPGDTARVSDFQFESKAELDALDHPFDRSVFDRALEMLDYDQPLQGFIEHRDFAPWNLKWLPTGTLGLLDWEWSVSHSLPWQDICRMFYLDDVHFNGPGTVWQTMTSNRLLQDYCRKFEVPRAALPPLTMRYLLRAFAMDWACGNDRLARYSFSQIKELLQVST